MCPPNIPEVADRLVENSEIFLLAGESLRHERKRTGSLVTG